MSELTKRDKGSSPVHAGRSSSPSSKLPFVDFEVVTLPFANCARAVTDLLRGVADNVGDLLFFVECEMKEVRASNAPAIATDFAATEQLLSLQQQTHTGSGDWITLLMDERIRG